MPGRTTPTFDAGSVPAGLLRAHRTVVWAQLVVSRGTVTFVDEGDDVVSARSKTVVTPNEPHTISPDRPHHIVPSDDAEFHVQFYDLAGE